METHSIDYPLAEYCPVGYKNAREAFLEACRTNKQVTLVESRLQAGFGMNIEEPLRSVITQSSE